MSSSPINLRRTLQIPLAFFDSGGNSPISEPGQNQENHVKMPSMVTFLKEVCDRQKIIKHRVFEMDENQDFCPFVNI